MKRLLLYINGILAIRTQPLTEEEQKRRIECWQWAFGDNVKIELEKP